MNSILASEYFNDFIIPLISVFLTSAIKIVSRKDSSLGLQREDFAIGFDLLVTSLILIVTFGSRTALLLNKNTLANEVDLKHKLELLPWIIVLFVIGLWGLSTLIRIKGWESNHQKLHKWWGVALPAILGVISLMITVRYFK